MTLGEYINELILFVKRNPWLEDIPVYTSSDDEWNYYTPVIFWPSAWYLDPEDPQFFYWPTDFINEEPPVDGKNPINAVVLN